MFTQKCEQLLENDALCIEKFRNYMHLINMFYFIAYTELPACSNNLYFVIEFKILNKTLYISIMFFKNLYYEDTRTLQAQEDIFTFMFVLEVDATFSHCRKMKNLKTDINQSKKKKILINKYI